MIASGQADFAIDLSAAGSFATNGHGDHSPGGYSLLSALFIEVILTAVFLWGILGATDGRAPVGFAPIAGLSCTFLFAAKS
ncbi:MULTISPECIES: hypothetical protein [unclassified Brachybacterium]|uniref:hypothetical protein n=1 Tax=unclassified Brachybacterium TaxID=2623841 RepID=UPI004033E4E1